MKRDNEKFTLKYNIKIAHIQTRALKIRNLLADQKLTFVGRFWRRGVSNKPGAIAFTRIPETEKSRANGKVIAEIAPFDAEYALYKLNITLNNINMIKEIPVLLVHHKQQQRKYL